jgi:hypothetical protein
MLPDVQHHEDAKRWVDVHIVLLDLHDDRPLGQATPS